MRLSCPSSESPEHEIQRVPTGHGMVVSVHVLKFLGSPARDDLMAKQFPHSLPIGVDMRLSTVERSGGQGFLGPDPHRASTGGGVALLAWRVCGELLQHLLLEGRLGRLDKGKPLEPFYVFQWRWRTGSTRTVS